MKIMKTLINLIRNKEKFNALVVYIRADTATEEKWFPIVLEFLTFRAFKKLTNVK